MTGQAENHLAELTAAHTPTELCQRIMLGKMVIWLIGKDEAHPAVKDHYFELLDEFLISDDERSLFGLKPRQAA